MEIGRTYEHALAGQTKRGSLTPVSARQTRSLLPWDIAKHLGEVIHFALITVFVFAFAYVLGRVILVGPVGNDSLLHIANAEWFDRFLPDIPNWFPLQGGGISLQRSYSVLPYLLVGVTGRIADISLVQAYRLISFISVPAAALSVYLFCLVLLNSRTIGLIAAVLFLLSPISWSWIFIQGYLATTVAIVSLPLTLLCFDRYMTCLVSGQIGVRRRWWLVGLIASFSITVLLHVLVAAAAIAGMAFYALSLAIVSGKGRRLRTLVIGVRSVLVCGLITGLILAFWAVPLLTYTRTTNPHGQGRLAESSIPRPSLAELFSTKPLNAQEWGWYRDSSLPTVIGVLFVVGAVGAAFSSRKTLAIAMTGAAAIGYTLVPEVAINLNKIFAMWSAVISVRSFTVLASVLFPVVAAYGAWAVPMALVTAIGFLFGHDRPPRLRRSRLMTATTGIFVSLIALLIMVAALYLLRSVSIESDARVNYGLSRSGMNVQDIWGTGDSSGSLIDQLAPDSWPPFEIAEGDPKIEEVDRVANFLPDREFLRMDVSPYLGMYAQSLAVQSGASQINTYIWPANLMWSIWGYQQKVLFIASPPENEFGTPSTLNEAADWFGTEFVYLHPVEDRSDTYSKAGWVPIIQEESLELWQYPRAPGLATLSSRPRVLVISNELLGAYEMVFRAANRGAIPYREAFLVKGREDVDSYSLEELRDFDVLFLEGYSYRDSERAWLLLDQYVSQGGSLFIDTGWQWGVPEWEFDVAPSVLPVSSLRWTDLGTTTNYGLESAEISVGLDPSEFAPLIWNGTPWGVSTASKEQVKSWGDIVLSANGQPLVVAGRYGEGRVVWSGMNLVAHSDDKDNEAEIELLHHLVQWLLAHTSAGDFPVEISRSHPDQIEFTINVPPGERAALLWRESYYPAWHAYLRSDDGESQELPIYAGGPGFMLIPIKDGQGAGVVELIWETPLIERLAAAISILALMTLGIFLFDGIFLRGRAFERVTRRLKFAEKQKRSKGSVAWLPNAGEDPFYAE